MKTGPIGEGRNKGEENPPPIRGLRMKDLVEATGLPKSAILHYVAQGLLPEPVRTGPNMAYYDPVCIERVRFIKAMQGTYSFPLSKIRLLLSQKDQGKNIDPLVELSGTIFGKEDGTALGEEEFCQATGLSRDEVKKLMEAGLLLPLDTAVFTGYDVAVGKIYAGGIAMGTKLSDMTFYVEAAKQIVDGEMKLRKKLTSHLPEEQDAATTKRLVEAARSVRNYVIDRVFQRRVASMDDLKDGVKT
jgi:DNA-binding transcriptional MerR regulator